MKCKADIEVLAESKLEDAKCLLANGRYDGAYYLAGYVIELLLKASVCKTLGIDDFFTFDSNKAKQEIYKPYKAHDYKQLLLFSGLYRDFENESNTASFKFHWSVVILWDENSRYLTGKNQKEVESFISSVSEIAEWIKKKL